MFFAVVERTGVIVTNACIRLVDPVGQIGEPHYFFSISRQALARPPWRQGTVYLLPKEGFIPDHPKPFGEFSVQVAQLASFDPVIPLARITVTPRTSPSCRRSAATTTTASPNTLRRYPQGRRCRIELELR